MSTPNEQIALAERLQDLWLKRMEMLFQSGDITSTDMATLARVLLANGWTLDRRQIPQGLRDKMHKLVEPGDLDEDDAVLARIG